MKEKISINYSELSKLIEENTSFKDDYNDDFKNEKGDYLSNTDRVGDVFDIQLPPTIDIIQKINDMGGDVALDKSKKYDLLISNHYSPVMTGVYVIVNDLNDRCVSHEDGEPVLISGLEKAKTFIEFKFGGYNLVKKNLKPVELIAFFQGKLNENYIRTDGQVFYGSRGAGVLPICTKTGKILVAKRAPNVEQPGTWGVWGGKIDDHEKHPKEAALREFNEETKYVGSLKLIDAYVFEKGSFKYYNFIGLLENEFVPHLDWENSGYQWLSYNELLNLDNKHFGLSALIGNSHDIIKKYSDINQENNINENLELSNKEQIVYRGTEHPEDFLKNEYCWVSEDADVAEEYGNNIYELKINTENCFDSLDEKDIQLLYNEGFILVDSYLNSEEAIDDYGEYVIINDDDEVTYPNPKSFLHVCDSDTWEPIETTDGVLDWINSNYNSIRITEGGVINYIINKKCIKDYKLISGRDTIKKPLVTKAGWTKVNGQWVSVNQ